MSIAFITSPAASVSASFSSPPSLTRGTVLLSASIVVVVFLFLPSAAMAADNLAARLWLQIVAGAKLIVVGAASCGGSHCRRRPARLGNLGRAQLGGQR